MSILKTKDFWIGFLIGYALVVFVPSLNFKNKFGG